VLLLFGDRMSRKPLYKQKNATPNPDLPWPQSGETLLPGWETGKSYLCFN